MATPLTIMGLHGSTCTRLVIATCEEAGVSWTLKDVDITTGAQKAADYVEKFHPFGQIPALVDGDYTLFESRAIARYVASKGEASEFYPADAKTRGLVDAWLSVEQSNFRFLGENLTEFYFGPLFYGKPADATKLPALIEKLDAAFAVLELRLAKSKFLAGDHFTLADLVFLPYATYLFQSSGLENVLDKHTHVKTWFDTISARPSWKVATSHGFGY